MINTKELKEDENVKEKEEGKENSDSSVDVEILFRCFNVGKKRENNESPSDCSPKKKLFTTVTKKTSQHLKKNQKMMFLTKKGLMKCHLSHHKISNYIKKS